MIETIKARVEAFNMRLESISYLLYWAAVGHCELAGVCRMLNLFDSAVDQINYRIRDNALVALRTPPLTAFNTLRGVRARASRYDLR
ncbi:hypothetical protein [Bradyrhizobium japonicum]|uniref:hypothetical protein n=1 Tax=Bradyrhizobium japonicum TaxID=375 RepID=UPI001BA74C10|nr:hypothetical protein [Bradyrhizobium japonicum]MBR0959859.1 hypothetical protein [Bradyrhizobium japonicum]